MSARDEVSVGVLEADARNLLNGVRASVREAGIDVRRGRRAVLGLDLKPARAEFLLRPLTPSVFV